MVKSQFSTDLLFSRTPVSETERLVLAVYHGMLVQIVVSKQETHFTNPFGEVKEKTPPACPECGEIGFGLTEIDGWLWCDSGECGFKLDKDSYHKALDYFNSKEYDIDEFVQETPIISLVEDQI